MRTIEAVATTSGSPAAVWALLTDASTWTRWGSWSKVKAPFRLRERVTEWVPGERMAYKLVDGMRSA